MTLERLDGVFSVCKIESEGASVSQGGKYRFLSVTDDEISLVCLSEDVPESTLAREDGWKGLRVKGTLDFSLIGILAELSAILAKEGIGIFVISTYDTDYLFVKEENYEKGCEALVCAGHLVTK